MAEASCTGQSKPEGIANLRKPALLHLPQDSAQAQLANKEQWNASRESKLADFFTIGYSGRAPDVFIDTLVVAEVATLVDVRKNPVSMYKPLFSKRNLAAALAKRGIRYLHRPDLGVPREIRALSTDTGSRQVIWDWYDQEVVPSFARRNLHHFFNFSDHPIAMMCTELDPTSCHRHRLSVALEALGLRSYDL